MQPMNVNAYLPVWKYSICDKTILANNALAFHISVGL